MARCNKCGRDIPRRTGVYKVMKTGKYTGGSDYHRTVSLCDRCAQAMDTEEVEKKKKQSTFILMGLALVVVVGLVVYFTYFR